LIHFSNKVYRNTFWDTLLAQTTNRTLFQERTVQHAWWMSAQQPPLQLVVISADATPVALFPLYEVDHSLQFLGDQDVSDYLDALLLPQYADRAVEAFGEFLQQSASYKLSLVSLPERSLLLERLQALATTNGWQYQRTQQDVCPVIELPNSWEEYLAFIGKKQRHEIKRKWARLEEHGEVKFRTVTDTTADPHALETFFTLHRQSSVEKDQFWTPEHLSYFTDLSRTASEHGWLRLYFLDFNGTPAATMYCFEYGDELLIYNSGFNAEDLVDRSVGSVMMAYAHHEYAQESNLSSGSQKEFL
jgi:CelD/BcsL family acetyltransferase involved in cellulose biosynthesis